MDNNIEENIDLLIRNWFYNLNNNNLNDSILLIVYPLPLDHIQKLSITNKQQLKLYDSSRFLNYSLLNNTKSNQIITCPNGQLDFDKIDKKLLIIPANHNFYKDLNNYINSKYYTEISIDENEQYIYWLQKENIISLIQNSNSQYLYSLINTKLKMIGMIYLNINEIITQNISIDNFQGENLDTDIKMLCRYKVLTSRLAIIIYRIAFLELNANTTKIGRRIHDLTGSKSKTFTVKMILSLSNSSITISKDLLAKKNFKAYNLNVNDAEIAIRSEIANNLLSFNIKELTPELIHKATKLPIETIKKLNLKFD